MILSGRSSFKKLASVLWLVMAGCNAYGQDIPLFTQKLTNSFLYNPAVAGNTLGSFTISRRQYWSGMEDSPSTNFLSLHTPFSYHKVGAGLNFYQDNVGVAQTLFTSAAFAYHIRITDYNVFSMGVSGEYNIFKVNHSRVDVIDRDDILLSELNTYSQADFSFGVSYHSRYFKTGASANRIGNFLGIGDSAVNQFPSYYTAFLNLTFPLANERDLIEPIVTYRSPAPGSHQIDAGVYYTFNNLITLGGGYRTGGVANITTALRYKSVLVGYSREMLSANYQRNIGATNEITFRIDFRDHNLHSKSKNSRRVNTQALAIRRKTLTSSYSSRGTSTQKSVRYKKKLKKNYLKSPNYRISASKKLQSVKMKKSSFHKKKRKHSYHKRRR